MTALKRAITVLTSLALVFALTACSEMDPNYGVSEKEITKQEKMEDIDTPIMSSDRVMSNYVDISLFDEENYSDIYLGKKFQIEAEFAEEDLMVPATLEEMNELGWVLADGNEYNEKSLVFAYETIDVVFRNQQGITINAQCYNSSRSSVTLSKCRVVKFRIDNNFFVDGTNYIPFNVNGITNTLAVTDVIDVLGTPSHFYEVSDTCYYLDYFITKRDRRNGITVYINPIDDVVTAVEFSYYK